MNFLAHLEVARRRFGDDDPVPLLGSMLPDLISVTALKVGDLERWPTAAAAGIWCHRRADEAFHADPRFVAGMTALRVDLVERGFSRGAARGASHVAWELALDGTILGDPALRTAYERALAAPPADWVPDGDDAEVDGWVEVVRRYRERGLPASTDAATLAERIVALLARRPRLAVDPSLTAELAAVIAAHEPTIAAQADAVIDATTAQAGGSEGGGSV